MEHISSDGEGNVEHYPHCNDLCSGDDHYLSDYRQALFDSADRVGRDTIMGQNGVAVGWMRGALEDPLPARARLAAFIYRGTAPTQDGSSVDIQVTVWGDDSAELIVRKPDGRWSRPVVLEGERQ